MPSTAGSPRAGHREEIQALSLHPHSFTEREIARLLTDPDEVQSQAEKQRATIAQEGQAH